MRDHFAGQTNYTYDNAGRLISLTNPFGEATTYNYDGDGNMLTKTESGQTTTYAYNYEDKMVGVNLPGGTSIVYSYDHEGKRIGKTAGGATVDYYFDGDDLITEAQGATILAYYTQEQGLISQRRGSSFYFYHYDGLGSTKVLTDASQNVQASYIYDAWGNVLQSSGTVTNPYLYVGELGYYADGDSGMYLLTRRWYNPLVGRFVARDIFRKTTSNLYHYSFNNPITNTDPSGAKVRVDAPSQYHNQIEIAVEVICKLLPKYTACIVKCDDKPGKGLELLQCLQDCCKWGRVIYNVNHPTCKGQDEKGPPCGFANGTPKPGGGGRFIERCVAHLCPPQFENPWGCFPLYGTVVHEWTHSCGYEEETVPKRVEDCLFGIYGGSPDKY